VGWPLHLFVWKSIFWISSLSSRDGLYISHDLQVERCSWLLLCYPISVQTSRVVTDQTVHEIHHIQTDIM
jgi:hypothetical protein